MSINSAMFSASSGLTTYGNAMTAIGNNLANANTTAYKKNNATFKDVFLGRTMEAKSGGGVLTADVTPNMGQGAFEFTGNVTDMAIDGKGFFKVVDTADPGAPTEFYTRAGDFRRDVAGRLVTNDGYVVQGWKLDGNGDRIGAPDHIDFSEISSVSKTTSTVRISSNLNASAIAPAAAYDAANDTTYNYATAVRVYDSTGNGHNMAVHFRKTATDNTWEWHVAALDGGDINGGTDGVTTEIAQPTDNTKPTGAGYTVGTLEFSSSGALKKEGSIPITFTWTGGAAPQEILFDFGAATDADSTNDFSKYDRNVANEDNTYLDFISEKHVADSGDSGTSGTVQMAAGFSTTSTIQDGFPAGHLESLDVDESGNIIGGFTNGQSTALYQVALATFGNEQALQRIGGNLYRESAFSGEALVGQPNTSQLGSIIGNSLEQSNVDMSNEFVNMVRIQRAFQANSRVVSLTDSMLEELINLKR